MHSDYIVKLLLRRERYRVKGIRYFLLITILLSGCGSEPTAQISPEKGEKDSSSTSSSFDSSKAGHVNGQLKWRGPLPNVPLISYAMPKVEGPGFDTRTTENPNRPQIDSATLAIADAVVYLRKIDPARVRPWDLPSVSVTIGDPRITVTQGSHRGRVGFVRSGDSITVESSEPTLHILRGRGAGFFSLTLPSPNEPVIRKLNHAGRIELSSGTGLSWMRADLFVCDHPYYSLTGANGCFSFDQVPVGNVEVVVWLPNWEAGKPIREPESTIIARQTYSPPIERVIPLTIEKGHPAVLDISIP
jgi:hypothetical protein